MRKLLVLSVLGPLGLILLGVAVLGGGAGCLPGGGGSGGGELSDRAREEIPEDMARLYQRMARRWDVDVAFLAAIGAQETDHGRAPGTRKVNPSGCQGVMQLGIGIGLCGDFWPRNKCDGDGNGRMRILSAADNICAAARGLRRDKNAPPAGGPETGYYQAACNYYGACTDASASYAPEVMARAKRYGFRPGQRTDANRFASNIGEPAAACAAPASGGGSGEFVVDPGANRPGAGLSPELTAFLRRMAGFLPRPPVVTTGTNHSQTTTSGNVSDHWTGNGADFGSVRNGFPSTGGGYGDTIAAAALQAAGEPAASARAKAKRGGAWTLIWRGLRVQIIWKSYVGGNHFDHPHVGVRRKG